MAKSDKTMRSDGQRLILETHAAGVCVRHNFEGLTARMLVEVPKRAIALIYSLQPYEETHGLASNITHCRLRLSASGAVVPVVAAAAERDLLTLRVEEEGLDFNGGFCL